MQFSFLKDLKAFLQESYNVELPELEFSLCPADFQGDITVSCFPLAKMLRKNPMQIAQQVLEYLEKHEDIEAVEAIKAFVNVSLKAAALMRDTVEDEKALFAAVQVLEEEKQHILIEFSAPNTNKPQHLGHVRNNIIGMAAAGILKRAGHKVSRVNLINDRGIHICKSMIAYQLFGNETTPEKEGKKGDHLVGDFYVLFDKEFRKQIEELKKNQPELADKDAEDLFLLTEIGSNAQKMLQQWEQNDPEVHKLWAKMNSWVIEGFDETYKKMGVVFEHTYLESQTYALGRDIVLKGLEDGVFKKREDGAIIIEFADDNLGDKVVLRNDGTSLYVTQDIGTTLLKQKDFSPDRQIWVVGDEQMYHFKVLFEILKALGYDWADQLTHMAYGMVNLPSGRMKSREGTVVDADDLIIELEKLAEEATLQRSKEVPEDIKKRAEAIGLAALKFMLLKVNPKTTILFDPQASIKFEGDTGPYIMYAYARISSMLRRVENLQETVSKAQWELLVDETEKKLALRCALFPAAVKKAAKELDSSVLAAYLLDLAKDFSTFYNRCSVLNAEEEMLRNSRIALSTRVREILKDGLNTLTIETLESM